MKVRKIPHGNSLKARWKKFRKQVKAALPYVSRRRYRILETQYDELIRVMTPCVSERCHLASQAPLSMTLDAPAEKRELCLFVTYAPKPSLKFHVIHHMKSFSDAGFDVVLIINTDHAAHDFVLPPDIDSICQKVFIRRNLGFDFAAWAHAFASIAPDLGCIDRLVMVNDSLIGPVDSAQFNRILDRFRGSSADFFGLTENPLPRWHIQSFFLGFQHRALQGNLLNNLMASIQNLPTKELVIEAYETRLSQVLKNHGLSCEVMFKNYSDGLSNTNDTYFNWDLLMTDGFPYLKISVLSEGITDPEVRAAVPEFLLQPWEQEQIKPK